MLNTKQKEIYEAVLYSDETIFSLTGEGGAGKSFTVAAIVKDYNGSIALTATTHTAKDVLNKVTKSKRAKTTQSTLGFRMEKEGFSQNLIKVQKSQQASLLIVDEVSMLPYMVYKAILDDLSKGTYAKVLFLGDDIQLPSIGKGISSDDIPGMHINLTEQMRQQDSDISTINYFASLRKAIKNQTKMPSLVGLKDIKIYDSHKEFCTTYLNTETNKKVVAYRNRVVNKYNEFIHSNEEQFTKGDIVVINKPLSNYNNEIIANNGEEVTIIEATKLSEMWRLKVKTIDDKIATLNHWHSNSKLEEALGALERNNQLINYWEIKDSAFDLKHVYASTIFKIQGASVSEIFVDGTDLWTAHNAPATKYNNPISKDVFLRLLYVGISRMKLKAHIFIGPVRNYNYLIQK